MSNITQRDEQIWMKLYGGVLGGTVNGCISLNDIWQKIRLHYNIQKSGSQFLDLADITLQPDEKPEDLYQRLVAFYTDNLLEVKGDTEHHGEKLELDEEITPTIENTSHAMVTTPSPRPTPTGETMVRDRITTPLTRIHKTRNLTSPPLTLR